MIGTIVLTLLDKVLGIGGDALERSQKRQEVQLEAETKIAIARAEAEVLRLSKSQDAEIDWDQSAVSQMNGSWKDEYWTFLLSVPVVLAFCGDWGNRVVTKGFEALTLVPDWYMWAVLTSIAASFGYRALVNRFGLGKR